jgi:hypothetical protein
MTAVISGAASRVVTVRDVPGGRLAMFEDPEADHQIVHFTVGGGLRIAVSCTCLRADGARQRYRRGQWIEARTRWEPGEAVAAWKAWHGKGAGT